MKGKWTYYSINCKPVNCFSQKLHCSQAVFAKECGITEEEVLSLAVVLAAVCERGKCVEL